VLIKGNAWLLLFVPIYAAVLAGRRDVLASPRPYVAGAAAAAVVMPWYLLTASISADGFNYQAGFRYAMDALGANILTLAANVGWIGLALAALALGCEYRDRSGNPARWAMISGCISLVLATLTLQSLVPADIVDRYMVPALPPLVILSVVGATYLFNWVNKHVGALVAGALFILAAIAMSWSGISHLSQHRPKVDLRLADAVPRLAERAQPVAWIIDGTSGAEGAFIAEMAIRDPALQHFAVRASKVFADSDFMGKRYRTKLPDSRTMLAELHRLGVQGIVQVRIADRPAFPHSQQLAETLARPDSRYRRTATLLHANRSGATEVFEADGAVTVNVAALRQLALPARAPAGVRPAGQRQPSNEEN
jgi:hypothetical protein